MQAKILCVDDEPSILQALERLLKNNFHVLTSNSAEEGLKTLKQHPDCAVVVSDYMMPTMNGVDFLRQVRAFYPDVSRAILSGQIDLQNISEALNRTDIHKLFLKPWENDHLIVQILEAVQLHHTLKEKTRFEHLAITDSVTQITNHRFFQDQIRRQLSRGQEPVALIIFDVDHFKAFNDRFGHPDGDRLLWQVAQALERFAKPLGGIVSRYGGEEFTIILPDRSQEEAFEFAERVLKHFENTPFPGLSTSPAYVTLSAGLALYPTHGKTAAELIENADRALYQAKRQGRNQVASAKRGKK